LAPYCFYCILIVLHKYLIIILHVFFFADDVKLYTLIMCRYDFVNLQSSLDRLLDWSNEYQLPIPVRKCSCIVLGDIDTSQVHYSINDQPVNTVSEVRDLGVIVDSSLKFNSHISAILSRKQILVHSCDTQP